MSNLLPRVSIVLSLSESSIGLEHALASLVAQTHPDVECIVVALYADETTRAILDRFRDKIILFENSTMDPVMTLNQAFAATRGEVMAWLDANDRLFAWTCERVALVFDRLPEILWLTSVIPYHWTPDQFCVAAATGLGYSRKTFFAGRTLPGAAAFRHPIWRAGTFWRRALWESSGARVTATLQDAGDFELWARFWKQTMLATTDLPLGGRQAAAPDFLYTPRYFDAARNILGGNVSSRVTEKFLQGIKRQLARALPSLRARWSTRALYVLNHNMNEDFAASVRPLV